MSDPLTLTVERLPAGGMRLSAPGLPGWNATVHGPFEIARAIDAAWVEADIASYARTRGTVRDIESYDDHINHVRCWPADPGRPDPAPDVAPSPRLLRLARAADERAVRRQQVASARQVQTVGQRELERARKWARRSDGMWRSPGGRMFREDSQHVRWVITILAEHGETPRPFPQLQLILGGGDASSGRSGVQEG